MSGGWCLGLKASMDREGGRRGFIFLRHGKRALGLRPSHTLPHRERKQVCEIKREGKAVPVLYIGKEESCHKGGQSPHTCRTYV